MQKNRIVLNGKGAANPLVREAINRIRNEGHALEVRPTWESGDAARIADEALKDNVDILVAGGGDGTINEVVNGLFAVNDSPAITLGILPLGTANDFARSNNIPLDPYEALKLVAGNESVKIDVAKANDQYFLNVVSGGFGAEVTANTPVDLKKKLGAAAYALIGVLSVSKMTVYHGHLVGPDHDEQLSAVVMAVGNGRQAGGGFQITPKAMLDDGLLDIMLIKDFPNTEIGVVLAELNDIDNPDNRYVYYKQLPYFEVEGSQTAPVNLDGEPYRWDNIRFQVLQQRLNIILPSTTPLLSSV